MAVDANGADLGPAEVAAGAVLAARQGVRSLLFGPADAFGDLELDLAGGLIEIVDAPVSIAKVGDPVAAARSTKDASIVLASRAVAEGRADALVSGGSTGAALAAGVLNIKRAHGIHRPALAVPIPVPGHPVTLLDVGANNEVRPEHLVQFAFMGAALAATVLGVRRPRVALLSNGEEPTKGTPLVQEAHALLAQRAAASPMLDFVGNTEGTAMLAGGVDVVVADGFTGNVALKLIEGVSQQTLGYIRAAATGSPRGRLGGLLLRPDLQRLRAELDPETPGGAYLLGLRKLGVVAHGRFTRVGFSQAIVLAARGVRNDVIGQTHAALDEAGALRRRPSLASGETATVPGTP